jgi:hypothetical protein
VLEDGPREVGLGGGERRLRPIALARGPVLPAPAVVPLAERDVRREVVRPRLARDEGLELGGPRRLLGPLVLEEALERAAEDLRLEGADAGEVDVTERPEAIALGAAVVAEGLVDGRGVEVGDLLHGEVDRVEPEGGARAVRARLAGRELVRGEDLHEALARARRPPREGREVRDLPDAPVAAGADGRERHGDAGDARAAGASGHGETGLFARDPRSRKCGARAAGGRRAGGG